MVASATSIQRYDIVVIGSGIAGISIAELLARQTSLRVKVLEQAKKLGEGASGKLEGWFHTGALYSGSEDPQTFMNCVNALEDLINLYSGYFEKRCNFELQEKAPNIFVPSVIPRNDGWFDTTPVYCILPSDEAPDLKRSSLKSEIVLWRMQRDRIMSRLEAVYSGMYNWRGSDGCRAPSPDWIDKHENITGALQEPNEGLEDICMRHDQTYHVEPSRYITVRSSDVPMDPTRIMRDLVASAMDHGVDFETGAHLECFGQDSNGTGRVESVRYRDQKDRSIHLKARLFILSVGAGLERLGQFFKVRTGVHVTKSYMIVTHPSLTDLNFVRMSPKARFHFNHLKAASTGSRGRMEYSILANSGYVGGEAETHEFVGGTDALVDMAERYFGEHFLYNRQLHAYECLKTEFIGLAEEKRRYSYWIEWDEAGGCMYVLPGKFSFFPTVALQTVHKVKEVLGRTQMQGRLDGKGSSRFSPSEETLAAATRLVADHYPYRLIVPTSGSE